MSVSLKAIGTFIVAFLLGTGYAILVGMLAGALQAPLIAWPIFTVLFWLLFWKFNLLRFAGYLAVLPVSLIGFEFISPASRPGMNADKYVAFDRSHYTPMFRVKNPLASQTDPGRAGWGLKEILIGKDGFRADPETGQGNPDKCRDVLIGDSMIYGSGLPYPRTLRPVLAGMGVDACVFGVTGNSPVDYLATLKYAAQRIQPGAQIAFYLYAYNDFVGLRKYFRRDFLSLSNRFHKLFEWAFDFDRWRRTTFLFSWVHSERAPQRTITWQYDIGKREKFRILYDSDPGKYVSPEPLNAGQRAALKFFLNRVANFARGRSWHIFIVIHPGDSEIYANIARGSPVLVNLDPRRADALKICKETSFVCDDMSSYIYGQLMAEGKNPYFVDNLHFSAFGTQLVAQHFVRLTKSLQ